jgi:uncharacterized protein
MANECRVVFDANVLVSALLAPASTPRQSLKRARASGKILLSESTLRELIEIVERPRFDRYLRIELRREFLDELATEAEMIYPRVTITDCRDPKDNQYLELAVDGIATHLVTGDKDLLVMNPFRGILILQPQDFLATIAQD